MIYLVLAFNTMFKKKKKKKKNEKVKSSTASGPKVKICCQDLDRVSPVRLLNWVQNVKVPPKFSIQDRKYLI